MIRTLKPKCCKACRNPFQPRNSMQAVCFSPICAEAYVQAKRELGERRLLKAERSATRKAKQALKPLSHWHGKCQEDFNDWVRARDIVAGYGCISCGTKNGKMNAGHYRSVGSCPELRYRENQVWLQCERCNSYLSANLINYRVELVRRIGLEAVEEIEGPHKPMKATATELRALAATYRARTRALKAQRESMLEAA